MWREVWTNVVVVWPSYYRYFAPIHPLILLAAIGLLAGLARRADAARWGAALCLVMFLGAFIFWVVELLHKGRPTSVNQAVLDNQEPICAGLIAGGALMGIVVAVVEVFFLS